MKRRTLKSYMRLYRDPTTLFPGAETILWPNGEREIWCSSLDHKLGLRIRVSAGKAGLYVELNPFVGTPDVRVYGNLADSYEMYPSKGQSPPLLHDVHVIQNYSTPWAEAFRAWYEGRGPYPLPGSEGEERTS